MRRRFLPWLNDKWPRLLVVTIFVMAGYSRTLGQQTTADRVIIRHLSAADRIPFNLVDLTFDNQGLLWICPQLDNIRIFDGRHLRILETSLAAGTPRWEYSRILKDSAGRLYFLSEWQNFLYHIDSTGQLAQDTDRTSTHSLWPFNNGYAYFDWDNFIRNGRDKERQAERKQLRAQLAAQKTFYAFNDSTFICKTGDSLLIFSEGRRRLFPAERVSYPNAFLLNGHLFIFGTSGLSRLTEPAGKLEKVVLTGDIFKDSSYDPNHAAAPFTVYLSEHPHIVVNQRLYRVVFRDTSQLETVLVFDLSHFQYRINKIEYNPRQEITAIATSDDGIFLVRTNPFYPTHFDDRFLALKRKQIYYPVILRAKDTFFTGWGEFTGRGYYRIIDTPHTGAKFIYKDHTGTIWEGTRTTVSRYEPGLMKKVTVPIPSPSNRIADMAEDERGNLFAVSDRSILEYKNGTFEDKKTADFPKVVGLGQLKYIGNGIFWFGTTNGLFSYESHLNRVSKVQAVPEVPVLNIAKLTGGGSFLPVMTRHFTFTTKRVVCIRSPSNLAFP